MMSSTGRVAEWFKAHAWKACGAQALAGLNPVSSALKWYKILFSRKYTLDNSFYATTIKPTGTHTKSVLCFGTKLRFTISAASAVRYYFQNCS